MSPRREIRASRVVPARQKEVFEFLADLENHWRLADRFIDVLTLEREAGGRAHGGRVHMRGPLGLRRTAATRVLAADPAQQIVGVAEIGRQTRAFVRWKLNERDAGTEVRLEATVDRTGWLDRLLLVLGGRAWLERRFRAVLDRLAEASRSDRGRSGGSPAPPPAIRGRRWTWAASSTGTRPSGHGPYRCRDSCRRTQTRRGRSS